jgi:thiosulfate dehydrogenase
MRQVMAGRGIPGVKPPREASPDRGEVVYQYQCALCHGRNGEGVARADGLGYQFPPLWGPDAYNFGAGMNKIRTAAGFIKHNMPPGKPGSLTDQDAIDISFYLRMQDRPWDPRVGWFSVLMGDLADG